MNRSRGGGGMKCPPVRRNGSALLWELMISWMNWNELMIQQSTVIKNERCHSAATMTRWDSDTMDEDGKGTGAEDWIALRCLGYNEMWLWLKWNQFSGRQRLSLFYCYIVRIVYLCFHPASDLTQFIFSFVLNESNVWRGVRCDFDVHFKVWGPRFKSSV